MRQLSSINFQMILFVDLDPFIGLCLVVGNDAVDTGILEGLQEFRILLIRIDIAIHQDVAVLFDDIRYSCHFV